MSDPAALADRYIEVWNETDATRRKTLIAALWTPDASFSDPVASGDGVDGVDAVIAGIQSQFAGFRFNLIGKPDGFGDFVRLSWGLGPQGGEAVVKGTDFGRLENGRLKTVTGFFDQLPG